MFQGWETDVSNLKNSSQWHESTGVPSLKLVINENYPNWIPRELVKKNKCSAIAVVFQNDLDHSDMWILLKDFIPNHQRKYPLHYHVTTTGKTFMTLTLFLRVTLLWLLHWSKYLSAWIMDWQQWYLLLIWLFLWPAGIKEQVMMSQVKAGFEKPD